MPAAVATPSATWTSRPLLHWCLATALAVVAGALVFEACDVSVFKRIGMAHEFCYLREPRLIWLHVVSDVLIGVAYVSISATLAYLVHKASRDLPFNWILLAFGLFIVSCGMTHFMEVWVVWEPVYWLSGYVKVVTAIASVATAAALFPLVPKIFRLIESARNSERRRVEIEQLNDELERFNYTVAHDLRAPLRGITGFGQAQPEEFGDQLPPLARSYIDQMQRSAARMDALICNLLKYATVGRQEIAHRAIPLEEAVRAALALLASEITRTGAVVKVAPELPVVMADATLLQVIFQNLVGNALKFVRPDARPVVEIAANSAAGRAVVTVTDNGLGIPPEARPQVFRMFERFHPDQPGTGIGLAIVHRAVERLGGKITVDSGPAGVGTRFTIELPLA